VPSNSGVRSVGFSLRASLALLGATIPRRNIQILIAVLTLAALTASATDFWLAKDWKQWSKSESAGLLVESPWAHVWRGGNDQRINPSNDSTANTRPVVGYGLVYAVQLRSSLPIRQALVRQQQLDQKYDKMTDAQRSAFDTRAAQILDRKFDDAILVHVDFSEGGAGPNLATDLREFAQKRENLHVSLLTSDGARIAASRVDVSPREAAFDAIFPRMVNGAPAIKEGDKGFSIQFQSPQLLIVGDVTLPAQPVEVKFDLSKMMVAGKLNY
jgi:hypothetical protein